MEMEFGFVVFDFDSSLFFNDLAIVFSSLLGEDTSVFIT